LLRYCSGLNSELVRMQTSAFDTRGFSAHSTPLGLGRSKSHHISNRAHPRLRS
jgi:hypothetical protein